MPLNFTTVAPVKLAPVTVTLVPRTPLAGEKLAAGLAELPKSRIVFATDYPQGGQDDDHGFTAWCGEGAAGFRRTGDVSLDESGARGRRHGAPRHVAPVDAGGGVVESGAEA